ncbi:hypothetical protein [Neobacillus rhizophilus]|uniref:Uncharacterized protein n=1 Tax=Neobacillus rhizophilus TaxID=2833579 RepID=A0A942U8N3_9BACI|nr:hypothetical protein [Neobacillus rhizophilus]MBS4212904.1 hypothetical protein [Neobacillus rhizophilus]
MYHYKYTKLAEQRQSYNNQTQIFAPPLHFQQQMPKPNQINGLGSSAGWSGPVNPVGWWNPVGNNSGHPVNWAVHVNQAGLNAHGQPTSWTPVNQTGLSAHGQPATWAPVNQTGLNTQGQMMGWGGPGRLPDWGNYGYPAGWGNPRVPMGWWNNAGQGQPGMFGGLLKVGKGALGGLGILSSLISIGRFLF